MRRCSRSSRWPRAWPPSWPRRRIAQPLREFVGTGPYKFKERKPDQYVLLTRFDGYAARKEAASGYGGKRAATVEELRFVPVPNANTRVEGALAGQFHYADLLPIEALGRLEKAGGGKVVPIMTPSFGFPYLVFNTKEGSMAQQPVRKAVQTALGEGEMLAAGFGDTALLHRRGQSLPEGHAVLFRCRHRGLQPARSQEGEEPRPSRPATRASRCAS